MCLLWFVGFNRLIFYIFKFNVFMGEWTKALGSPVGESYNIYLIFNIPFPGRSSAKIPFRRRGREVHR